MVAASQTVYRGPKVLYDSHSPCPLGFRDVVKHLKPFSPLNEHLAKFGSSMSNNTGQHSALFSRLRSATFNVYLPNLYITHMIVTSEAVGTCENNLPGVTLVQFFQDLPGFLLKFANSID